MPWFHTPKSWKNFERRETPETFFLTRRTLLYSTGLAVLNHVTVEAFSGPSKPIPIRRNSAFQLDRPITDENVATRYNNFREFTDQKEAVWTMADSFPTKPWTVAVRGLVGRPRTFDLDTLVRQMPVEERLYRHRCIEGWSMAVPWTGFPFNSLIDLVEPTTDARYVLLQSFYRPDQAEGQRLHKQYQWPMRSALTLAEARNELAFLVTGMYGHELPKSNGAPIRLAVPWKYGFKSIKSIVSIEFTAEQPANLWNEPGHAPHDFYANVNPNDSGPRYSQARERVIGTWETRSTLPYNGYGAWVAQLYK